MNYQHSMMDITGLWVESFVIMLIHTKCFHRSKHTYNFKNSGKCWSFFLVRCLIFRVLDFKCCVYFSFQSSAQCHRYIVSTRIKSCQPPRCSNHDLCQDCALHFSCNYFFIELYLKRECHPIVLFTLTYLHLTCLHLAAPQ